MKNKVWRIGLLLMVLTFLAPYAHGQQYDMESDFQVRESGNGVIIIGYTGRNMNVRIPPRIQGKPVIEIDRSAFYNKALTSVVIPDSVVAIGDNTFRENQLTSVTIGNSVTTIGDAAFFRNLLTRVTIPNSMTRIGNNAFRGNRLTSVTIPNSVTSIGDYAFAENQLTGASVSNRTSIGNGVFGGANVTRRSAVDLWNGFTSEMTREQVLARARDVLRVTRPIQEERFELSNIFAIDDNVKNRFPRNLTSVGLDSPLQQLGQTSFLGYIIPNVNFIFSDNKLFAIRITWEFPTGGFGTTSTQLLAQVRNEYGELRVITKELSGYPRTSYAGETPEKITYCQGVVQMIINKQLLVN